MNPVLYDDNLHMPKRTILISEQFMMHINPTGRQASTTQININFVAYQMDNSMLFASLVR